MEDVDGIEANKKEGVRARARTGSGSKGSGEGKEGSELRKAYPAWRRLVRYCITIPPVLAALAVILIVMSTVFTTQVM
jgi:hypothetical protein